MKSKEDERKEVGELICNGIHFAGQIGDYVIHDAIEKLIEWKNIQAAQEVEEYKKRLIEKFNDREDGRFYHSDLINETK